MVVCTVLRNIRFEYSVPSPPLSSPMNPPLTVTKMVHMTIIHFMQICYTAVCMLTKVI